MCSTIVVLGGYGQAGRAILSLLLKRPDTSIVIAGRRMEQAEALAHRLDPSGQRVQACYADASQPETLRAAFHGASLVIVTAAAPQYAANIAQACLDSSCDYFDILETADVLETLQKMDAIVSKARRLFITQGGLAPGLQSAFVYLACRKLDRCRSVRIGNALDFTQMERPEQVTDVFEFALKSQPYIFREGGWQKRPLGEDQALIDFGPCRGTRPTVLLDMAELRGIPEQLGLEEMTFYGAVPGVFLYIPINILLAIFNRLKGSPIWNSLASMILWASKHLMRERCAYSIVIEACGHRGDKAQTVRVVLEHEDNYFSTAAAVIAFLNQYDAGSFSQLAGVKVMGHIVDPEKMMSDIAAFGLHTDISISEA
jgi:NAD(P)-dependent dehydrogenase (short-subunit alcohol dehydrogenase family)